ncbi:MAG: aldo/keto reductase [Planctomycetota bacterium]|nr:aldo/keto reductase [Planctomycetota bacterium]
MADRKMTRREFVKQSAVAAAGLAAAAAAAQAAETDTKKILNYNPNMEYRRLGKTGLMISAVCLGGHWKRIDKVVRTEGVGWLSGSIDHPDFQKNRYDVVTRCIEAGMNYIDACWSNEVMAYTRAVKGRRDKIYMGCSWGDKELRFAPYRTKDALLKSLENGLKTSGLDYADLWRITMHEQSGKHTEGEVEEMMKALEAAKKAGKARFTGFSSHDRPHIKGMIEKYPTIVDALCTPYTAKTKELPQDSLFETVRKYDVGVFGIKPFASNSIFKGDSSLASPTAEEDDRLARMAIRYILANPAVTAPIPGLINNHQVDNVALAVKERRELDKAEKAELDKAMNEAWARLPPDYQWLKDWEYV